MNIELGLLTLSSRSNNHHQPSGTLLFQGLGLPKKIGDVIAIPMCSLSHIGLQNFDFFDYLWYKDSDNFSVEDLKEEIIGTHRIKGHFCCKNPEENVTLSWISIDDKPIQIIGFTKDMFIFRRLGKEITIDTSSIKVNQRFTLRCEWSPNHIFARISYAEGENIDEMFSADLYRDHLNLKSQPPQIRDERLRILEKRVEFDTPTFLPIEAIKTLWENQKETIKDKDANNQPISNVGMLRKTYADQRDFESTIKEILFEIQNSLIKTKPTAFWNGDNPKSEPDSGYVLRAFFEAICSYKNIKVTQEDPSRSGNVDFKFFGIDENYNHVSLLIELKNAHSLKLKDGITKQLPKYIEESRVLSGFYFVLWFKGKNCSSPKSFKTVNECLEELQRIKPQEVKEVFVLDVSFKTMASKL